MSKNHLLVLSAVLALSLVAAACGDDADDDAEAPSPAPYVTDAPEATSPPADEAEAPEPEMPESEATEGSDEMSESEPAEPEAPGTIVEVAVASEAFPTLVAAVQAAGLVDVLNSEGPFTVFAPTEEAFAAALAALGLSAEDLLADTELLTAVLTYPSCHWPHQPKPCSPSTAKASQPSTAPTSPSPSTATQSWSTTPPW